MRTRALWLFPTIGILLASSPLQAVPVHHWSKRFGNFDEQHSYSVATDIYGNVVATGYFRSTVDFGGGPLTSASGYDIFLAKFDADGNHLWSKRFGGVVDQYSYSVAADGSGNVIITGYFGGTVDFGGGPLNEDGADIFVAKFDADGNHLWSQRFGDANAQVGNSVAADASGNVVVTGLFYGGVDFGGGPLTSAGFSDIFVAKFDTHGNHIWSQRFGDTEFQSGNAIVTGGSGDVVVTGGFSGTVDFGGGSLTSAGDGDIFVAQFDADGNHLWSQRFGDADNQIGQSVAVDGSGNVVVTGEFYGTVDFGGGPLTSAGSNDIFVAQFDADGNHDWSQRFGDADSQDGYSVAAGGSGNVVITGYFQGTVDFGGGPLTSAGAGDIFVAQFDVSGNHLWSRGFGDADHQLGSFVAADGVGNVVITGDFRGAVDFGSGPLTSAGSYDIFVVKFKQPPLPVLITSFAAKPLAGAVEIRWDVWSDEALESFTLYRRDDIHPTAIVIAEGPVDATARSYVDASVEPGKTYHYELLIHTQGGDDFRSPVATVTVPELEATLGQNHPNPFNPETTIDYTLGERSPAVVTIYDAAGAVVARLDQGMQDAGAHHVTWNGRDTHGHGVASGVYFYSLEGAKHLEARKMVLLK